MDRLEIVDIPTLLRSKPLNTPLCKKRIRAWNQKVQSVARSPKTPDPLDSDSHVPPVARAPRQNNPQSIAPSSSQLEIVDISTLPRGNPLETPLCKKRIRAWNPKVQSVARSPKTVDTTADDDVTPVNDSYVPPVARAPRQNTPQWIAPSFSQLEIVDISTLPRGNPLETPLCKKRIRAWNPKVQSVARSPKTVDTTADDDVTPVNDSYVPPVARAPRQNTPQLIAPSFSQLEIVDISTLPRGKPLETPLCKQRIRAWNPKMQIVARSPKTLDTTADDDAAPDTDSHVPPVASSSSLCSRKMQSVARSPKTLDTTADDDAAPDTDSHVPPVASSSSLKKSPPSIAPRFIEKVQSVARLPKTLDTTADDDAAPDTDSHVPPVARTPRQNIPQWIAPSFSQLEIVDISSLLRGKPSETPLGKKRKRAWNPKVQSVARSPKTLDTTADDDAAPDTDSHVPPVARTPRQNTPQWIAPSFSQLEIVDISTLLRGKPSETPLGKKRKLAWNPKVQSVARSPKTLDTTADDDAAPDTDSHVPPVASSSPLKNSPPSIAPNLYLQ